MNRTSPLNHRRRLATALMSLLGGAALAVAASAGAEASGRTAGGFSCGYVATDAPGGFLIEGRIASGRPASGSYEIFVLRRGMGGRALVTTSGDFAAAAGAPATTGTILFGGSAAQHEIRMHVRVNGRRIACAPLDGSL
jgi:hypothetical protein